MCTYTHTHTSTYLQWMSVVDDLKIITGYLFSPALPPASPSNSRPSRLWSWASSSVVLKVFVLLCPLAWLPAYSHWSEPEGRLPRNTDHLAQTESFELSLASFPLLPVSSSAPLFPLLKLTTKTSSGSSLMWDPLLIFFPYVFVPYSCTTFIFR